jgi:MFS family permease
MTSSEDSLPRARTAAGSQARTRTTALIRGRPAYRRLCGAVAVSETGDWLLFIALPLYVLQVSGSALDTSTVFLAELIPAVVAGIVCGPLIDRWAPGRLLAWVTGAQALLLLPLLWVAPDTVWMVYVVAGLQAAATSVTLPALQALVPGLVARAELPVANTTVQMASNAARLIGSPLGGLLLVALGLKALVLGDMISFLASAGLLAGCARAVATGGAGAGAGERDEPARRANAHPERSGNAAPPTDIGRRGAIAEGWRAIRRAPTLAAALTVSFLAAIAQGLFLVLFVFFVLRLLRAGDEVVGLLRGVQAIGGVLGGLVVGAWATRLGPRALAVSGLAGFGLVSMLTWNSPTLTTATWWYVALFIAVGIPATALGTGLLTGTQAASPPAVRGRVLSLLQVAQALGQGVGILAAGLLAGRVSLGLLLNLQASCYLACAGVAVLGFARPLRARAQRERLDRPRQRA